MQGGLGTVSEIGTAAARPYHIIVGSSKSKAVLYTVPTGTRDLSVGHTGLLHNSQNYHTMTVSSTIS